MKRRLVLVAASGLAREVVETVRAADAYEVLGFVDDNAALHGTLIDGVPVLGGIDDLPDLLGSTGGKGPAEVLLCAGKGSSRHALASRLAAADFGPRYATVIHPSVIVPKSCEVGSGTILLAGCVLTASVRIGAHVVAMPQVTMTHDDEVGDYATLAAGVSLGGTVQVGQRVYLGMNSAVREGCSIGADAVIGMGAAVVSDVPAGQIWVGVPARPMKQDHSSASSSDRDNARKVIGV